jgi:hypothetical protein
MVQRSGRYTKYLPKKLGLFYQKLVYLSMFFVGFIVINQVVGWFLRVDYLECYLKMTAMNYPQYSLD